ncbi:MAG: carboxypeptidase regulatory-like domain-containing protein [Acidobacteria bacterium]|nr:carboxypeptidase regulatory-like domain-containing protein [Acidobacteriota bacterium]
MGASTLPRFLFIILLGLYAAADVCGQATAVVQISGVVSDPSGAVVAGAAVKATQTGTGFTRTAVADVSGSYILSNLPVGPYTLEATASGFKSYVQRGIVLQVNTNPTINVVLEVGAVSQSVEVSANAAMAETQQTAISQVIDNQRILDLPLNGRQATQLVLLSGAAVIPPNRGIVSSKNYPGSLTISVAGGQANGTYYLMDGGDHNDKFGDINLPMPFPDALQEFSVETNTIPASYGVRAGATVNIVTKSGTNDLHGSLFEFLRTGTTNARNFFAPERDSLKRNQFGGTLGGPVVRNKLFFFGGYQSTRLRTAPQTQTAFVPTPAMLAGDFSTIASSACGSARTLIDPATRIPFPGNQIPVSRLATESFALLKFVPASDDPCGKLLYGIPERQDESQVLGRVDWLRSERHSIFGRYFFTDLADPGVFDGTNLLTTSKPAVEPRVQSTVIGDTFSITPTTINSFHFTFNRENITRGSIPNLPSAEDIGLKIAPSPGNFPNITVTGGFSTSCGTCALAQINNQTFQFANDTNLVRGRHQISFGVNYMRTTQYYRVTTPEQSSFGFNGSLAGLGLADFMLGRPYTFRQGNASLNEQLQRYFGLYVDEKFRMSRRFSLNAGVRWEPYFPLIPGKGKVTHFDMEAFAAGRYSRVFTSAPAGLFFPGDDGMPGESGTSQRLANFAPRLGLIWDPTGGGVMTVRASYAMLYDLPNTQYFHRFTVGPPWGASMTINAPEGGFGNPYLNYPGGNPFPLPDPPPSDAVFPAGGEFANLPLHIRTMNTQQWNLSIQRQVGANWLLSASYLGNKSSHRWINKEINPAVYIPGTCGAGPCSTIANTANRRFMTLARPADGAKVGRMIETDDGANANYNAMLLSVKRRFHRNLSLLVNYTWSHCISEGFFNSEQSGTSYQDPSNRAADRSSCDSDVQHLLNSSLVVTSPALGGDMVRRLTGDWQVATIITKRSGFWVSPSTGADNSRTAVGGDRPDVMGDWRLSDPSLSRWFDKTVFKANAIGTYGNSAPNSIEGPGAFNFDMALSRVFAITERTRLEFRGEAFNVLNHPVFDNPITNVSNSNFGRILSAHDPRILQFALKISF